MIVRTRLRITGLAAILFGLMAAHAAADEPEIAVEVGSTDVFSGESIDYVVEIKNVKNPSPPDLTAARGGFDIVANGDDSRNSSRTFIFNGKVSQQTTFSHFYRFKLTPKRTGTMVIPAPSVTIDGKVLSGRAIAINVIAPEEQDLVIPEIKTDRVKVYPTQPLEVTLRVLVRPLPDDSDRDPLSALRRNPPHINVNWVDLPAGFSGLEKSRWLERLLAEDGIGFTLNDITMQSGSFFGGPRPAVFNLSQGRERRKDRQGEEVKYFVYELKRKLIPEKAGTYAMGPAVVKGTFADGMDGGRYTGRRLVAVAPPVTLDVREVPSPRPATFCGGIGNYRVTAAASPNSLRVGDPLTLRLDIERGQGSGSLDLISAPNLESNEKLAADFEIIDKNPTGRTEASVKRFEYALRPKRAGVGVPPISLTVFNPDTEAFSEIATEPIALSVSGVNQLGAEELIGAPGGSGNVEIKAQAQGLFHNVTDPTEIVDQRVNVVALAGGAAGTWCLAGCLMGFVALQRRRSGDLLWQRKRNARRVANGRLAEARKALADGQSLAALRAVRSAIIGLVADSRNIVAEGLTASEADAVLADAAVPDDLRKALSELLGKIESAEYGSGVTTEASAMIEQAQRLVESLPRHLARNGAGV